MAHKLDSEKKLWEKAAAFHGHVCPGLTIGYRAALYAIDLLGLTFSDDEQVVCITENDACGVDAIQAILGCSIGKGNLLFHMRGKQAFSFYNRKTGKSVRLVLKARPRDMTREEMTSPFVEKVSYPDFLRSRGGVEKTFLNLLSFSLISAILSPEWEEIPSFSADNIKVFYHLCRGKSILSSVFFVGHLSLSENTAAARSNICINGTFSQY